MYTFVNWTLETCFHANKLNSFVFSHSFQNANHFKCAVEPKHDVTTPRARARVSR